MPKTTLSEEKNNLEAERLRYFQSPLMKHGTGKKPKAEDEKPDDDSGDVSEPPCEPDGVNAQMKSDNDNDKTIIIDD